MHSLVVGHDSGTGLLRHVVPPTLSAPLFFADRGGHSFLYFVADDCAVELQRDPYGVGMGWVLLSHG